MSPDMAVPIIVLYQGRQKDHGLIKFSFGLDTFMVCADGD